MKIIIQVIVGCIVIGFYSCATEENQTTKHAITLNTYTWLIGNWEQRSNEGLAIEQWTQKDDTTFVGFSYFIKDNDTLFAEKVSFEERGNNLFYIPITLNQNEGKPISFAAHTLRDDFMAFENVAHDFPQRISYQLINNDSIYAEISGKSKGIDKKVPFPYHRVKK